MSFFDRFRKKKKADTHPSWDPGKKPDVVDAAKKYAGMKEANLAAQPAARQGAEIKKDKKSKQESATAKEKPAKVSQSFFSRVKRKEQKETEVKKLQSKGSSDDGPAKAQQAVHTAHKVLIRPIITEKATLSGTYIFEVSPDANKSEVKKAIMTAYGVKSPRVRIMQVSGKEVRWNYRNGQRKSWKKAVVRLHGDETINVYEGT